MTRSKLGLGSSQAANVDLDRSSLNSGFRSCIDKSKSVDPLLDQIVRTPPRACEGSLQRGIESQWGPRCKDWLNLQLA